MLLVNKFCTFFVLLVGLINTNAQSTTQWTADLFNVTENLENCGSLYVSVEVTQPPDFPPGTIVSANALFPPYSYSLSQREVVEVESGDNLCNGSLSTSAYDGKILLVTIDTYNCSIQYQVYRAQTAGAKAVLFANNQDGTAVYQLSGDGSFDEGNITIPARMISQNDGDALSFVIEANGRPGVELNCEYGDYAQSLVLFVVFFFSVSFV